MAENCPNKRKKIVIVVQGAERVPSKINPRRNTLRHIVIKLTNTKENFFFFTATGENQQITYRGTPVRILVDFSAETLQARRQLHEIFKVMEGKNLQARIFYTKRASFRFDGEIKSFTDMQKLREFSTT